jgi:hypothetical protein
MTRMNTIAQTQTLDLSLDTKTITDIFKTVTSVFAMITVLTVFLCLPMILYIVTKAGI